MMTILYASSGTAVVSSERPSSTRPMLHTSVAQSVESPDKSAASHLQQCVVT